MTSADKRSICSDMPTASPLSLAATVGTSPTTSMNPKSTGRCITAIKATVGAVSTASTVETNVMLEPIEVTWRTVVHRSFEPPQNNNQTHILHMLQNLLVQSYSNTNGGGDIMTYGSGHGLQLRRQSRSYPSIPARSTTPKIITSIAFGSTDAYLMGWKPRYYERCQD